MYTWASVPTSDNRLGPRGYQWVARVVGTVQRGRSANNRVGRRYQPCSACSIRWRQRCCARICFRDTTRRRAREGVRTLLGARSVCSQKFVALDRFPYRCRRRFRIGWTFACRRGVHPRRALQCEVARSWANLDECSQHPYNVVPEQRYDKVWLRNLGRDS